MIHVALVHSQHALTAADDTARARGVPTSRHTKADTAASRRGGGCLSARQNFGVAEGALPVALGQPLCHAAAMETMLARQRRNTVVSLKLAEAYGTLATHELLLGHFWQAIDALSAGRGFWRGLIQQQQ